MLKARFFDKEPSSSETVKRPRLTNLQKAVEDLTYLKPLAEGVCNERNSAVNGLKTMLAQYEGLDTYVKVLSLEVHALKAKERHGLNSSGTFNLLPLSVQQVRSFIEEYKKLDGFIMIAYEKLQKLSNHYQQYRKEYDCLVTREAKYQELYFFGEMDTEKDEEESALDLFARVAYTFNNKLTSLAHDLEEISKTLDYTNQLSYYKRAIERISLRNGELRERPASAPSSLI